MGAIHGRSCPLTSTFLNQIPQARPSSPSSGQMAIRWLPFPASHRMQAFYSIPRLSQTKSWRLSVPSQCKPCMKYLKYVKEKQEKGHEKDFNNMK